MPAATSCCNARWTADPRCSTRAAMCGGSAACASARVKERRPEARRGRKGPLGGAHSEGMTAASSSTADAYGASSSSPPPAQRTPPPPGAPIASAASPSSSAAPPSPAARPASAYRVTCRSAAPPTTTSAPSATRRISALRITPRDAMTCGNSAACASACVKERRPEDSSGQRGPPGDAHREGMAAASSSDKPIARGAAPSPPEKGAPPPSSARPAAIQRPTRRRRACLAVLRARWRVSPRSCSGRLREEHQHAIRHQLPQRA